MIDRNFIFVAGLHRSGTSLIHEIIREHTEISGISGAGVPQDEGQHVQNVIPAARAFGGPGKFAFDEQSYMDEFHPLATDENATELFNQWSEYFDLSKKYLLEKSPPTVVRTRFFQKIFPNSKFIVILRHPIAVSYATQKWSKTTIQSLLEHTLLAYEIILKDMGELNSVYMMRYEDFVLDPQGTIDSVFKFLGLDSIKIEHEIRSGVNQKYFEEWNTHRRKILSRVFKMNTNELERRANVFGYSIEDCEKPVPVSWMGIHQRNN